MILVGISGGIAAIKVPELVKKLEAEGEEVRVIMTPSASNIVPPTSFKHTITHFSDDTIDVLKNRHVKHIDLADSASLYIIVPATANVIAKLAHGIADDYLTTTALAVSCPVLVCPSMNVHMWNHPATQQNIQRLRVLGYHTFGPDNGLLACGYEGEGRLPEIADICNEIDRFLKRSVSLKGKKVLVTAGGTIDPIDDVRQITNKSTGKMGIAIAHACKLSGAEVTLLRSETSIRPRYAMREYIFDTPESLQQLMQDHVPANDICFHVAAVSDFSVKKKLKGKIPSNTPLPLELEPRTKILDTIKSYNPHTFLVAFKAEYGVTDGQLISLATDRLKSSHADMIIANDVGRSDQGFQSENNDVWVIPKIGKPFHILLTSKQLVAEKIIDQIMESALV